MFFFQTVLFDHQCMHKKIMFAKRTIRNLLELQYLLWTDDEINLCQSDKEVTHHNPRK